MPTPEHSLLTAGEVMSQLGIKEAALRKLIRDGLFPASFAVSERKKGWLQQDVDAYLYLRSRIGMFPGGSLDDKSEEN